MSFDGKDSANTLEPKKECRECKKKGHVYYRGSTILRGNPFSPSADTEVRHYYFCENCNSEFTEGR